jgi:hypothetical protein
MPVQTEQQLQNGGAPEYVYRDITAWRCAGFVGGKYGSKGYPQKIFPGTCETVGQVFKFVWRLR